MKYRPTIALAVLMLTYIICKELVVFLMRFLTGE